jgi:hypothetical protein
MGASEIYDELSEASSDWHWHDLLHSFDGVFSLA